MVNNGNPNEPSRTPGRAVVAVFAAVVVAVFHGGCSSSYEDLTPELHVDGAGKALGVTLDLVDYRHSPPLHTTLSNASNQRAQKALRAGRLPVTHKIIKDEEMGRLIAFIRDQGFFDYASAVGNLSTAVPTSTRRTLNLQREGKQPLRMIELRGMGTPAAGRREEVVAISEMNKAIRQIANATLSLRVDRSGRTIKDLTNQPGLKRDTR